LPIFDPQAYAFPQIHRAASGSGKTKVPAQVIAWKQLSAARTNHLARFTATVKGPSMAFLVSAWKQGKLRPSNEGHLAGVSAVEDDLGGESVVK